MKIIKLRPFWSYDVLKTELWLEKLALKGYILKHVYFKRRMFVFERQNPQTLKYFINYDKKSNGDFEDLIKNTTYQTVCHDKSYYVLVSQNKTTPYKLHHDGIIDKNQKIRTVTGFILLYYLVMGFIPLFLIGTLMIFSDDFTITLGDERPMSTLGMSELWLMIMNGLISIGLFSWIIYSYFKTGSSNKKLRYRGMDTDGYKLIHSAISKESYHVLKQDKKLIKKTRLAWQYAPDKLERWLESMEKKGYQLVFVSKLGIRFHFVKGNNRIMKYHVDYQDTRNQEYFDINKDSGWHMMFTTLSKRFGYTIWQQAYEDTSPSFYSDQETKIKHAKKHALHNGLSLIPVSALYVFLIVNHVITQFNNNQILRSGIIINIVLFSIVATEFSYFAIQSIRYYYRVKKSYQDA